MAKVEERHLKVAEGVVRLYAVDHGMDYGEGHILEGLIARALADTEEKSGKTGPTLTAKE